MFSNRKAIFATKHAKEQVVKPIFSKELNIIVDVPESYDTDLFGTFSGEVERKDSALKTCIAKARDAAKQLDYDLAIASEGSFGPHPTMYFVPANIEFICLVDLKNDIEIIESFMTEETNYKHFDFKKDESYEKYLTDVKFPSHALILRNLMSDTVIEKAIDNREYLDALINKAFKSSVKLRLETDMRAMYNPMRMKAIEKVTQKLVERIKTKCPSCEAPGYGLVKTEGKLLCEFCHLPTDIYKYVTHNCIKCDYQEKFPREDGLKEVSMQYCQYCNP
jgi:hypothetical protein